MTGEKYTNYAQSNRERKVMVLFTGAGFSKAIANVPVMSEFLDFSQKCLDDSTLSGVHAGYEACRSFKEEQNMETAYSALKFLEFGYSGNLKVATRSQGTFVPSKESDLKLNSAISHFEEAISKVYGEEVIKQKDSWLSNSQQLLKKLQDKVDLAIVTTNYDLIPELSLASSTISYEIDRPTQQVNLGDVVPVFKLHGSVNWTNEPQHYTSELQIAPRPCIIPPSFFNGKNIADAFKAIWYNAFRMIEMCDYLVVFGHSFPESDHHLKYIISMGMSLPLSTYGINPKTIVIINKDEKRANEIQQFFQKFQLDTFQFRTPPIVEDIQVYNDVENFISVWDTWDTKKLAFGW